MNRRGFLKLVAASPVVALPTVAAPPQLLYGGILAGGMAEPPVTLFSEMYRGEFMACFEQRQELLRETAR